MVCIAAIAGVRPQYVKIAALQDEVKKYNNSHREKIDFIAINAGQHYNSELSENLIKELGIDFQYTLLHEKKEPINILANMIVGLHKVLEGIERELAEIEKDILNLLISSEAVLN